MLAAGAMKQPRHQRSRPSARSQAQAAAPPRRKLSPAGRALGLAAGAVVVLAVGGVLWTRRALPPKPDQAAATAATSTSPQPSAPTNAGNAALGEDFAESAPAPSHPAESLLGEFGTPLGGVEEAVQLLTQGNELLRQDKLPEAVAAYEAALKKDPESEDTHYNLAFALAKLGRTDEAIAHYQEALRILPDYAEAHNNLGNLLVKVGRLDEAVAHFHEAITVFPEYAAAHNNLGRALGQQGKVNEAILKFRKAIELQPDYLEAHFNLGNAYLLQGRPDEAIQQFETVLRLQPGFEPARRGLAKALQQRARAR